MGMKVILIIILVLILFLVGSFFYKNVTHIKKSLKKIYKAGFVEKQLKLKDGSILNYGEGASNGKTPLLLIHGQGMTWEDYAKVLPELSKHYHVFAIDCHGHGKSSMEPEKYTAKAMAEDFIEFIDTEIGKKTVISGHSSGGMIAAWMAAYFPDRILGTIIEDSPFFSTEPDRRENTYVWVYEFQLYEDFKNQDEEEDYLKYSLERSYWKRMFGESIWNKISSDAVEYHKKHPDEPVHLKYLPPVMNRIFETMTYPFDQRFGETFYDNSWFKDYDQLKVLSKVKSPTVFIKANTTYDGDLLVAALSDEDANRVVSLLENGERIDVDSPGHDIHYDKPKKFIKIVIEFLNELQ